MRRNGRCDPCGGGGGGGGGGKETSKRLNAVLKCSLAGEADAGRFNSSASAIGAVTLSALAWSSANNELIMS